MGLDKIPRCVEFMIVTSRIVVMLRGFHLWFLSLGLHEFLSLFFNIKKLTILFQINLCREGYHRYFQLYVYLIFIMFGF